jgi:hypothetical protein
MKYALLDRLLIASLLLVLCLLALSQVLRKCKEFSTEPEQVTEPEQNARTSDLVIKMPTGQELEVWPQDLGDMTVVDAKSACANLGSGWRLPTLEELQVMYEELHLKGKGNFDDDWYWSSTEEGADKAWLVFFIRGDDYDFNKDDHHQVRAVRAL